MPRVATRALPGARSPTFVDRLEVAALKRVYPCRRRSALPHQGVRAFADEAGAELLCDALARGVARQHGERQAAGKEPIKLNPRPTGAPLYARAGALIPMQPLVQHTGQTPDGPLQLHAYLPSPGSTAPCAGSLYQDDGTSFAHEGGAFLRMAFACEAARSTATITARVEHDGYAPWWQDIDVIVRGIARAPRGVRIDGRAVDGGSFDPATRALTLSVPAAKRAWRVEVGY